MNVAAGRLRQGWRRAAVGLCLFAALLGSTRVTRLAVSPTVGVDSPALSVLLVALGGSRGILSEILWWRIGDLQRQNRYAELVPLTDLLVTLEPSSPDVWIFNAWNLAYNVSVMHQESEERWRWVCRGVALIRRGLRHAPASQPLLRQMGWFFEDKIGGRNDDAASYYREHLAELGIPEDAGDFAQRVGFVPDWSLPKTHALYWYVRAGYAGDTLRVATALLRQTDDPALIPFYLETARAAWDDLALAQCEQVLDNVRALRSRYPRPELDAFLKEATL